MLASARGTLARALRRLAGADGLIALPTLAYLGLFLILPLAAILGLGATAGPYGRGELIATLLRPTVWGETLARTLAQATLSTALTLLIGLPAAYAFARYRFPLRRALRALASAPFVMPAVVVAAAFTALLGPRGALNAIAQAVTGRTDAPLQLLGTLPMILIAHAFYNVSVVIRVVGGFWSAIDPRLESAAATLGANRWRTLTAVTLPLALPAIGSAAALIFLFTFGSFGVVLLLGNPQWATLEVEIYRQTTWSLRLDVVAALAVIQMIVTALTGAVSARLSDRASAPLAMRPAEDIAVPPRGPAARALVALTVLVALGLCALPLAALVVSSLDLSAGLEPERVLRYYASLESNARLSAFFVPPITAIRRSLLVGAATAVLALAMGLPMAVVLVRARGEARRGATLASMALEALLLLPLGASAVTLGLGYIIAFSRPPLDWIGSPLLIPLAHTLIALPFVTRALTPALRALDPKLREAARTLGASPARARLAIDLPLLAQPMLAALTFSFTTSLGEFGASLLIARPENPTLPLLIARALAQPGALNYGQAMAMSTLLMTITALSVFAIERWQPERQR